jgi:hypothetical protein
MQRLLSGDPVYTGFFTINGDRSFRADDRANATTSTVIRDHFCRVIPFGSDTVIGESQHFLRTRCNTQFATLAILLGDYDPTLKGHSYLLKENPVSGY